MQPEMVSKLLELGAPVHPVNRTGATAANLAAVRDETLDCLRPMLAHITRALIVVHVCACACVRA